jgi:hypothetical protein
VKGVCAAAVVDGSRRQMGIDQPDPAAVDDPVVTRSCDCEGPSEVVGDANTHAFTLLLPAVQVRPRPSRSGRSSTTGPRVAFSKKPERRAARRARGVAGVQPRSRSATSTDDLIRSRASCWPCSKSPTKLSAEESRQLVGGGRPSDGVNSGSKNPSRPRWGPRCVRLCSSSALARSGERSVFCPVARARSQAY